jgi:hypothetical protein
MFSIKSLLPLAFAIFSTFFNPSSNCSLSFMDVLRRFLRGVDRLASGPPVSHTKTLDAFADLAMRLYTDASRYLLAQTIESEIGGALTDDTPPESSAEAI